MQQVYGDPKIKMIHRKTPCDICGSVHIRIVIRILEDTFLYPHKSYTERCLNCGQVLYGYVKVIRPEKDKILNEVRKQNANESGEIRTCFN